MEHRIRIAEAATGIVLRPDGSYDRAQDGGTYEERFATREDAIQRKDELLRLLRTAEVWLSSSAGKPERFCDDDYVLRHAIEQKATYKSRSLGRRIFDLFRR